MALPKILVFASGTSTGGGTGFENLVQQSQNPKGELQAEIVGVVSNHENGGVRQKAEKLGVAFFHFPAPYDPEKYQMYAKRTGAEWFALSGWLKKVQGLDPARTFNIHPALLSVLGGRFGGANMYGSKVLDAVYDALQKKEINEFGISMHFVTDEYDRGPVFFEYRMDAEPALDKEAIATIVHNAEHEWQPVITNLVVNGIIHWDGHDPKSLSVPESYTYLPKVN